MEHTIYYIIQEQKEMDHRDEEANGSGANRVQGPINIQSLLKQKKETKITTKRNGHLKLDYFFDSCASNFEFRLILHYLMVDEDFLFF